MSKKILMIDDESELLKVLHPRLAANGYEVVSAESGREGLEKAIKEKPGLIILDLLMPRMGGLEVLDQLKKDSQTKSVPVIMLTGKEDEESVARAKELGAVDYITKPFNPEALIDVAKKYLP
ncbi:MAG: response regulator [Candidatus Omnitrophica bacterium]|nr:response regulator [Candidatus Omnitrophota bacterium]MBU4457554.1 response regulator [Candidatus Omnitrophota bacterium]